MKNSHSLLQKTAALICVMAMSIAMPAFAANQTWNPGGAGGGAGSWNATNWDSAAAWTANNTAVFGGAAGTVTLNASSQTVGGLVFNVGGYTLSNGTLNLSGTPVISTTGGTTTFSSTLALSGAAVTQITKTGSGTLSLSAASGSLGSGAGPTVWTISGGTLSNGIYDSALSITGGNNLGAAPTAGAVQVILDAGSLIVVGNIITNRWIQVNAAGGTLEVNSAQSVDSSKIINNADSGHSFYVGSSSTGTVSSTINGTGSLTKIDTGTVTLSGANTYSGGTTISTGTLKLGNAVALGNSTAALAVNGGTLDLGGNGQGVGNFNGTGGIVLNSSNGTNVTLTIGNGNATGGNYAGVIADNGGGGANGTVALTKTGTGTLTLSGGSANTYTGTTTVTGGTLALSKTGVQAIAGNITLGDGTGGDVLQLLAANQIADTSIITLVGTTASNRGWLQLNGSNETIGGLVSATTGAGLVANESATLNSTLTLNVTGAQDFSGLIRNGNGSNGTLTIVKAGDGTQTLSGTNNTYTGGTQINAGSLQVASTGALGTTGNVTFGGGTLQYASGGNGTDYSSRIKSSGSAVSLDTNGQSVAMAGVIDSSNAAGLTKLGSGTLTLSGNNTYTGITTVSVGVLNIQNATALGSTGNGTTVSSGAALQIQGGIAVGSEALALSGTGISNDGALRNISGNNTFGGLVTLGAGTRINSDAGTLTLGNNGTITGSGFGLTVGGAGNTTIAGIIGTGTGTVTKDGSGKLVLFSTSSVGNTFTGGVFLNAGTLGVYEGSSLGQLPVSAATQLTFTGNSTLQFQATPVNFYNSNRKMAISAGVAATFDTQSFSAGIDGIISGFTGSLVKTGSGTLTLRGNNTYGGGTTISAGTLTLGNAGALGSATGALSVTGGNLNLGGFSATVGALTSLNGTISGFTLGTNALTVSSASVSGTNYIGITNAASASVGTYNLINSSGGGLTGTFQFSGAQDLTVPVNSIIAKTGSGFVRLTLNNTGTAEQVVVSNSIPANTINIMPLGASITFGTSSTGTAKNGDVITSYNGGGYHTQLYQSLVNDGRFNPNFIGSNTGLGAVNANGTNILTTAGQTASEGHSGYKTSQILYNLNHNDGAASANGGFWLSANNTATSGANSPTYIPLNVGGNDFADVSNRNTSVVNRYDAIISEVNTLRPGAATIVGSLAYRNDVGSYQNTYFNPYVPGIVYNHVLAGQDVRFLDFYTLLSPGNSTAILSADGIHPTQAGYNRMADAWNESILYGAAYWKGGQSGNWSTVNGTDTNWAMNRAGTIDRQTSLTDASTRTYTGAYADVFFNSNNSTLSTTVDANTSVRGLNFTSGATGAVSIGGNNTLTIGAGGITVQQGTGTHDLAANVALGADQTWGNVSSNKFTVSGVISGSGNLTITGGYSVQTAGAFTANASTSFEIVATNTSTVTGTGAILLAGNNTYTGTTTVTSGTLILNGTNSSTSGVVVESGATLGGSGKIAGAISGAGLVEPGNSPGIFTATRVNPSAGTDFNFEFTATGGPTFSNATASVNDVLHLNDSTTPFTASLTGSNAVSIYLNLAAVTAGNTFQGGFFTDKSEDFLSSINSAAFTYYVKGNGGGSHTYNGFDYYTLAEYNAGFSINWSTVQVGTAAFADGTVSNGYISQMNVIPEPATWALLAGGLTTIVVLRRRRA